ncbi:RNA polymerase sigma factor [Filimonas effusa]|uniref:Sigma-70 family RNA polymerase sigma factor n=1 Tax=Filimonas effusa TaxID=2508721 RepID=A0A4Q1D3X9_9BACT|nr:sigma-70 family RNA polymerase sigma factor [Filimonas effusa]RXK83079.1 sigma-70 family RNA polymerase sigma factor [Filimonas effusa]
MTNDEILLARIAKHDQEAFREIRERYQPYMRLQAFHILKCEQQAQDVVQECFIHIWEKPRQIDNLGAYLMTATRNKCKRALENRQREKKLLADFGLTMSRSYSTDPAATGELGRELNQAVLSLPPQQYKVFLAHHIEGKRYKDICEDHGMTEHAVRNYLNIALKKLREKLAHLT